MDCQNSLLIQNTDLTAYLLEAWLFATTSLLEETTFSKRNLSTIRQTPNVVDSKVPAV